MFSKANLTSTILVALWAYFGGWLLWGILSVDFFNDHLGSATGVAKEIPDMTHLIIGCLIIAFAFSTIYGKWANGNFGAGNGIVLGVWIAILIGLGIGIVDFATSNILDLVGTLGSAAIYVVFIGVMGLIAGFIYKKMS